MQLRLYTLSPLHIGTGEKLSPMDYFVHNRTFYRIEQDDLYQLVRKEIPDGTKIFAKWISDRFTDMRALRDNREQSRQSNRTNALAFFKDQGKQDVLLNHLKGKGQPVILDDDNRHRKGGEQRFGEVREAIRTAHRPYLPGTSIKGAIRTALLYDYLQRHGDINSMEKLISPQLANHRTRKEYFANPLEAEAFFCTQKTGNRERKQEAQMDLLKFLSVSDAHMVEKDTKLQLGKVNLYLIEKEKTRDRRQTPRIFASCQNQSSYVEMIPAGQELQTTLSVDSTTLTFLLQKAANSSIKIGRDEHFIGLRKKVQRLFNLSADLLDKPDKDQLEKAILSHCKKAMDQFSKAQLSRQDEWMEDYANQLDPEGYAPRVQAGFEPVTKYAGQHLHLGFGAGFSATTVLLYFLKDRGHQALFERIMDKFQLGRAPRQKGQYTPRIKRFPKSRRFIEGQGCILPLGWMALLKEDEDAPNVATQNAGAGHSFMPDNVAEEEKEPVEAVFYTGNINYKKPPIVDAVVTKSGRPNKVKVYLSEDNCLEMDLQSYRSPIEVGTVLQVQTQVTKKGALVAVSYRGEK